MMHLSILAALLAAVAPAADKPSTQPVAIVNVHVLRLDRGDILRGQTVVVDGGVIREIGPAGRIATPDGARTIDATGKYLMPGLVDLHVHLHGNPEQEQHALLKLFVANGVTTVLNLRGNPQILGLRADVAQGRVFGPTIYTAGPYVNEPSVTSADEVERAVVEQKRAGYDFIKLHGDLSREAYARLNAVARREGVRVVGHAPRNLGLDVLFEEGQYALTHAEEFVYDRQNTSRNAVARIEPKIPELARSMVQAKIWLMPNLTAYKMIRREVEDLDAVLARPEMRYLPATVQKIWGPATNPYTNRFDKKLVPEMKELYGLLEKIVRGFDVAGVRLLLGTDAMNTGVVPGTSAHDELADLVAAGLTPLEALRTATVNAAEFLSVPGQRGLIDVGQNADLVLLEANPLDDIGNSRRLAGVMLRGRWLSASDLRKMLDELAAP
jgi:imidazolonepropionase-like amidohydrolase